MTRLYNTVAILTRLLVGTCPPSPNERERGGNRSLDEKRDLGEETVHEWGSRMLEWRRGGSGIRGQFVDGCFAEPRPVRGERERARAEGHWRGETVHE